MKIHYIGRITYKMNENHVDFKYVNDTMEVQIFVDVYTFDEDMCAGDRATDIVKSELMDQASMNDPSSIRDVDIDIQKISQREYDDYIIGFKRKLKLVQSTMRP